MEEMKDNLGLKNLVRRFNEPLPDFWRKVLKLMLILGATGTAIIAAQLIPNAIIPPFLLTVAGYLITIGAVGTALTQFTTTNPQPPNKD